MQLIDFVVLAAYLVGTLAVGFYYSARNQRSSDMFAAGGRSPWWVSGLSGFMTLKSAGTFVVWGGLAYREGVVAIAINTCIGISALLVGWFVAGRWRRTGVTTPAEFVALRFGSGAVQLYTWAMMLLRIISTGVALYAVAVMLVALVPLEPGHPLRDDGTGHLSLAFAIGLFGLIIITYTVVGGLWAVLMTDVLQFIVLQLAALFVILLLWLDVRGASTLATLPEGFFLPFSSHYTPWFMLGWIAVHFFIVGAEWAFAQRYICVPAERDARRSAWLFGALYLISPALWLTPPILFRMLDAHASPEQAYILASERVLPAGLLGLMMAAMFSATASAVSGQINVFAGVLTEQFYQRRFRPLASQGRLVAAGRLFALVIGTALVLVALCVPSMGGAEKIVLTMTGMLFGPLMAPTIWGLMSGRIGSGTVYVTAFASFAAGMVLKFGVEPGRLPYTGALAEWIQSNPRMADVMVGAVLPVIILTIAQLVLRGSHGRWQAVQERMDRYTPTPADELAARDSSPMRIVAIAMGCSGLLTMGLMLINAQRRGALLVFGLVLIVIALLAWRAGWPRRARSIAR